MCDYITTLTLENADRKVQVERLAKLFSEVLNNGLSVVAVRIKPSLLERSRLGNKSLLATRSVVLIACTNQDKLAVMMEEIKRIKLWHLSSIRFLIGTKDLPEELRRRYCKNPPTVRDLQKNVYIENLKNFIIGTCDPLDDDINIYGGEQLKDIVCSVTEHE